MTLGRQHPGSDLGWEKHQLCLLQMARYLFATSFKLWVAPGEMTWAESCSRNHAWEFQRVETQLRSQTHVLFGGEMAMRRACKPVFCTGVFSTLLRRHMEQCLSQLVCLLSIRFSKTKCKGKIWRNALAITVKPRRNFTLKPNLF